MNPFLTLDTGWRRYDGFSNVKKSWNHCTSWAALAGVLAIGGLAACAGSLPRLTSAQKERAARLWPGTTARELGRGRTLYVRKCSGCHTLHLPAAYPAERWSAILDEMKGEARLPEGEAWDIERYVLTAAQ